MMNYEDFMTEVTDSIKAKLGAEYANATYKIEHMIKSNFEYDGLQIKPEGSYQCPVLNLTEAYDRYCATKDFDFVVLSLVNLYKKHVSVFLDKEDILDFDKAVSHVYPRLINRFTNAEYLKDKVYTNVGADLCFVNEVRVKEDDHGLFSCVVTHQLIDEWGISPEELNRYSLENLGANNPIFINLEEVMFMEMGGMVPEDRDIDSIDVEEYTAPFFALANKQHHFGAAYLLIDEVMDKITGLLGDLYILPSSVHEVIVFPAKIGRASDFKGIIEQVNSEELEACDRLGNNVYYYDSLTHKLSIAE